MTEKLGLLETKHVDVLLHNSLRSAQPTGKEPVCSYGVVKSFHCMDTCNARTLLIVHGRICKSLASRDEAWEVGVRNVHLFFSIGFSKNGVSCKVTTLPSSSLSLGAKPKVQYQFVSAPTSNSYAMPAVWMPCVSTLWWWKKNG